MVTKIHEKTKIFFEISWRFWNFQNVTCNLFVTCWKNFTKISVGSSFRGSVTCNLFFFVTLYIYIFFFFFFFFIKVIKKRSYKLQVGKSLYTPQKNVTCSTSYNKVTSYIFLVFLVIRSKLTKKAD